MRKSSHLLPLYLAAGLFEYRISKQPSYTPRHVFSIALIKRVPTLDSAVPVTQQLHLLSLFGPASASQGAAAASVTDVTNGEGAVDASKAVADLVTSVRESPYEALHSVVHNVMAPWFDAYIASKDKQVVSTSKNKDNDTRMGELYSRSPEQPQALTLHANLTSILI